MFVSVSKKIMIKIFLKMMLRFGCKSSERKILWCKKTIKIWHVNVDNIVILMIINYYDNVDDYVDDVLSWLQSFESD